MTFSNIIAILGIVISLVFGIWSVIKGKGHPQSRAGLIFLLLAFLYGGQFASEKWLGHGLISDTSFNMLLTFLVFGLFYMLRDG
jgi:hypothetical protein